MAKNGVKAAPARRNGLDQLESDDERLSAESEEGAEFGAEGDDGLAKRAARRRANGLDTHPHGNKSSYAPHHQHQHHAPNHSHPHSHHAQHQQQQQQQHHQNQHYAGSSGMEIDELSADRDAEGDLDAEGDPDEDAEGDPDVDVPMELNGMFVEQSANSVSYRATGHAAGAPNYSRDVYSVRRGPGRPRKHAGSSPSGHQLADLDTPSGR